MPMTGSVAGASQLLCAGWACCLVRRTEHRNAVVQYRMDQHQGMAKSTEKEKNDALRMNKVCSSFQ
jgi:hypothetical protein